MYIEHLRNAFRHWSTYRKVEPVNKTEEEFPLDKEEEEAVIVDIEFDDKEEEQELPKESIDQPERKHTLSIWV